MTGVVGLALLAACLAGEASPLVAQNERVGAVAALELHSAFWVNLHHTLYVSAWLHRGATGRRNRFPGAVPLAGDLTAIERRAWDDAVAYYDRTFAEKDLRTGEAMSEIADALARAGAEPPIAELAVDHRRHLVHAAPVYRRHWWPKHDAGNRAWVADVSPRLQAVAPGVTARLAALYRTPWYGEPDSPAAIVRVDIVHLGGARGAYTAVRPRVHAVIDSAEPGYEGWLGAEMLLHEASHGLVDRLRDDIARAGAQVDKEPGILWHTVLFYIVGEVVRQAVVARGTKFTSYLYETGLFDRAWPHFRKPVETHIKPYVDGQVTLDVALQRLIAAL